MMLFKYRTVKEGPARHISAETMLHAVRFLSAQDQSPPTYIEFVSKIDQADLSEVAARTTYALGEAVKNNDAVALLKIANFLKSRGLTHQQIWEMTDSAEPISVCRFEELLQGGEEKF